VDERKKEVIKLLSYSLIAFEIFDKSLGHSVIESVKTFGALISLITLESFIWFF